MVNVWLHPSYDTGPQLVLSNSDQTMTRVTGANTTENLPFNSDATIANGVGPTIFSIVFTGLYAADSILVGFRNATQTVTVGNYPGTAGSNSVGMGSDGAQYINNSPTSLISGGFSAGDQLDMEVDRTGSGTIRYRKNGGTWTATQSISALGTGTLTMWAATYSVGDVITIYNSGGGGGSSVTISTVMMMGV